MNQKNKLTGLVMCGGKSIRMGKDKGLLLKDGETWASLATNKLAACQIPVKISINNQQLTPYQNLFPKDSFIIDCLDIPGPLGGILSAHTQHKDQDLCILACDMTDLSLETIHLLIDIYQRMKDEYDFFVFKNGDEFEPLMGIYTHQGLKYIQQLYEKGQLEKHSMKYILGQGKVYSTSLNDLQKKEFRNYNQSSDL